MHIVRSTHDMLNWFKSDDPQCVYFQGPAFALADARHLKQVLEQHEGRPSWSLTVASALSILEREGLIHLAQKKQEHSAFTERTGLTISSYIAIKSASEQALLEGLQNES